MIGLLLLDFFLLSKTPFGAVSPRVWKWLIAPIITWLRNCLPAVPLFFLIKAQIPLILLIDFTKHVIISST